MPEALFYEKLENPVKSPRDHGASVRCRACHHFCLIPAGGRGICGVRENQGGKLYSLVYGKVAASHADPMEKKPLFHFFPGSRVFSFAAMGCNFRCLNCQNAEISQLPRENPAAYWGEETSPEQIVQEALDNGCQSVAATYTEPTVFAEFALDVMKAAKAKGLKNVWVSNGYMGEEVLQVITPYLDAINVDLKFFDEEMYQKVCGAKLRPILDNLKTIKKNKIWLEITTLIIPGYTDPVNPECSGHGASQLEKIAKFIAEELGRETPWHLARFFPAYKLSSVSPTPEETLRRAYAIGKEAGLKYVYLGNISTEDGENTYCPKCGNLAVSRSGYQTTRLDKDGRCPKCREDLNLILE